MKSCKKLSLLLFSLVGFFTSVSAFSQSMLLPEPTREMKMSARDAVEEWDKQLGLRAKQASLMERRFIEYALKREQLLQRDLPEEEKLKQLATLNTLEITGMRNVLTKPQYDWYVYLLKRKKSEKAVAENP